MLQFSHRKGYRSTDPYNPILLTQYTHKSRRDGYREIQNDTASTLRRAERSIHWNMNLKDDMATTGGVRGSEKVSTQCEKIDALRPLRKRVVARHKLEAAVRFFQFCQNRR